MIYNYSLTRSTYDNQQNTVIYEWVYNVVDSSTNIPVSVPFTGTETQLQIYLNTLSK